MINELTTTFWIGLGATFLLLIVYLFVVGVLHYKNKKQRSVSVDNLMHPLTSALTFIGICFAAVAAITAFGMEYLSSPAIDFLVLSGTCLLTGGCCALWFIFGVPNLAGTDNTIPFSSGDYDVAILPNATKFLSIAGSIFLGLFVISGSEQPTLPDSNNAGDPAEAVAPLLRSQGEIRCASRCIDQDTD